MVLVITSSFDETSNYIIEQYGSENFFRLNVDQLNRYDICIGNYGWEISLGNKTITKEITKSINYRKPILPNLDVFDKQYHTMIQRDIIAVINGFTDSFDGRVLTRPSILKKVENKVFQLVYAVENGINVPMSYIGNSNKICEKLCGENEIIKPLTTGKTYGDNGWELYNTSIFNCFDDDVSSSPVYLQEYIRKKYEVRITIVQEKIFAVRINTINQIDWRMDYIHHQYTVISCPIYIQEQCKKMMRDMEINFGAFDYIVTPDDEWFFLEVNPNGQWLWLELNQKINISEEIVNYLLEG